ncbi:MAG: hypothetical protein ABIQ02_14475 [Saprospiraceae bacterium]
MWRTRNNVAMWQCGDVVMWQCGDVVMWHRSFRLSLNDRSRFPINFSASLNI